MFVFGPFACLITIVSGFAPMYDERSACFSGLTLCLFCRPLFKVLTSNKLPLMDSNQTPASLLQGHLSYPKILMYKNLFIMHKKKKVFKIFSKLSVILWLSGRALR